MDCIGRGVLRSFQHDRGCSCVASSSLSCCMSGRGISFKLCFICFRAAFLRSTRFWVAIVTTAAGGTHGPFTNRLLLDPRNFSRYLNIPCTQMIKSSIFAKLVVVGSSSLSHVRNTSGESACAYKTATLSNSQGLSRFVISNTKVSQCAQQRPVRATDWVSSLERPHWAVLSNTEVALEIQTGSNADVRILRQSQSGHQAYGPLYRAAWSGLVHDQS
jgi:hypothetical protein